MDIEVEARVPTVAEYRNLRSSVGWRLHPDGAAAAALAGSLHGAVVTLHGEAVAMGRVVGDALYRFIVDVVTHEKHQGRGYGRLVVTSLVEQAQGEYPPMVGLITDDATVPFYEACGLERSADPYVAFPRS